MKGGGQGRWMTQQNKYYFNLKDKGLSFPKPNRVVWGPQ